MSTYEISKSSLLSLKAEILRKQEEVNKEKLLNKAKAAQGIKKGSPLDLKNKGVENRQKNDNIEDEDLLKKSRSALEAKAILYERLSKGGTNRDIDSRYLVQFRKKNDLPPSDSEEEDYDRYPEEDEEQHFSDEYEPARDPEEEWVEYIDCLGRTRKCMRKDLPYLKERDSDLRSRVGGEETDKKEIDEPSVPPEEEKIPDFDESSELLSSDMRTELLRRKWEKEEEELMNKSDVHYQDILFDEARVHGVGYYGFSKDEKEREKQQEALNKLREETEREQRKAEQLRQMRDKQLAVRTRAAKNRKRARLGLPPLEEDEEEDTKPAEAPVEEEVEKQKSPEEIAMEKEKEIMRLKHVRPWDYGKEGVKKEHVEYTQEDWVYIKRKERDREFAPPKSYDGKTKNKVDTSKPPPKINNPSRHKTEEVRPFSKIFDPIPIRDECVDFDDEQDELLKDYARCAATNDKKRRKGAEIAPPPTFDYYGPSDSKRSRTESKKVPIEESISAGLQFLRKQAEKKKRTPDNMDMFSM